MGKMVVHNLLTVADPWAEAQANREIEADLGPEPDTTGSTGITADDMVAAGYDKSAKVFADNQVLGDLNRIATERPGYADMLHDFGLKPIGPLDTYKKVHTLPPQAVEMFILLDKVVNTYSVRFRVDLWEKNSEDEPNIPWNLGIVAVAQYTDAYGAVHHFPVCSWGEGIITADEAVAKQRKKKIRKRILVLAVVAAIVAILAVVITLLVIHTGGSTPTPPAAPQPQPKPPNAHPHSGIGSISPNWDFTSSLYPVIHVIAYFGIGVACIGAIMGLGRIIKAWVRHECGLGVGIVQTVFSIVIGSASLQILMGKAPMLF